MYTSYTSRATQSLLALSIAFAVELPARRADAQGPIVPPTRTDVPVRNVVLYSSGVGYFEHAGTVRGTGTTEIRFKTDQINDVLKSLVLQDRDGGRVTAISYPSRDPVAKSLKSFQVDITANPGIAELLNQVRGTKVTALVGTEQVRGTILGVEVRRKAMERGAEAIPFPVLNILSGAMIRSVDLGAVRGVSLDDPKLDEELARALAALSQARDQDKKPVTISYSGGGERRLRIGYVVEAPVWRTSYRLIMDGPHARLQGWAIVENQTENDWNDVSLSLVSGRPISFTMDLYQPLYHARPNVVPEQFAGLQPKVYEAGVAKVASASLGAYGSLYGSPAANGAITITAAADATRRAQYGNALALNQVVVTGQSESEQLIGDETVQSIAQTARLGELFQYTVPNVSLGRRKSAMLPIITDSVGIERVSIYNASVLGSNPLNGVRLRNITGKHLLQGPVMVLDGDRYAGDARIDNVPPGQDRLLSYGVDLDVVVNDRALANTSAVVTGRVAKGLLTIERRYIDSKEYVVDNKGDQDKVVIVEHPYRTGWKLVDTQAPDETTASVRRFRVTVAAHRTASLKVREESVWADRIGMLASDTTLLINYSRTGEVPQAVREAIGRALQLKRELSETSRQLADRAKLVAEITLEQARIRDNMKTVSTGTLYYKRLLEKLNQQESSIERLQQERDGLSKRGDAQRKELEEFVANLSVS